MPRNAPVPAPVHHRQSGQARLRLEGRDLFPGPFGSEEADENDRRIVAEWLSTCVAAELISRSRAPALFAINPLVLAERKHAELVSDRPTRVLWVFWTPLWILRQLDSSATSAECGPRRLKEGSGNSTE